jgi:hypothetical protein
LDWPCSQHELRQNLKFSSLKLSIKCALSRRDFESELSGYLIFPATLY